MIRGLKGVPEVLIFAVISRRARLAIILLLVATLLQLAPGLPGSQPARAAQTGAVADTDVVPYGVNTFLDKEVEFWKKEKTMQLINQAGVKWIKQVFAWNEIEFRKGYFTDDKNKKPGWQKFDEIVDLATKYNIKIVARIDQTPAWANPAGGQPGGRPANLKDYSDFLREFVKHYKGKVQYVSVWNEPNLNREWIPGQPVDAKGYVEMLKMGYEAIKETDPSVKVMAAPLAITLETNPSIALNELTYLDQMYQAGAKQYFDIMPANAYGLEFAPEDAPNPQKLNFRRVELLHEIMVKNGDTNKAVWFNEYGWNASPASIPTAKRIWGRVSEQQQADYTVRGIKYAKQNWPWTGVIFIWFFRQVGDIPDDASEQHFQLVTKDFVPKPVYNSLKTEALAYFQQANIPTPAPVTPPVPATSTPIPVNTVARPNVATPGGAQSGSPAVTQAGGSSAQGTTVAVAGAPRGTATPVNRSSNTTTGATTPQQDDSNLLLLLVGGVLVLGAGGGLAFWLTQQRRRS